MSKAEAWWKAEEAKAVAAAAKAKSRAAVRKANARAMECRMAMRPAWPSEVKE